MSAADGPRSRPATCLPGLLLRVGVALLCALLAACGDDEDGTWAPRPGDSLIEHAERLRVHELPRTNVPLDLQAQGRAILDADAERVVAADDWIVRRGLSYEESASWQLPENASLWVARAPWRPAGAVPWLMHEGRLLAPHSERGGRREDLTRLAEWIDVEGGARLWWADDQRELRIARLEPPGEVRVVAQPLPGHPAGLEARLLGAERPKRADALVERVTLGNLRATDRACLLAPAPSRLSVHLDLRDVDELLLEVGLFDPRLVLGGEPLQSDGVIFRVDLDDGAGTGPRELARQVVRESGHWVRWRVPLPPTPRGGATLSLTTDPGPRANALADYAVWGELRLQGQPARAPERPHVVLIDVDTLRADHLGLYGYERDTTPRLDAWASEHALVFEQAQSTNSWTLPATATMLTGLTVAEHGVWGFPSRLGPEHESLAVRLARVGYETWADTEGGYVIPAFGFAHGFDVFDVSLDYARVPQRDAWLDLRERLAARRSERPLFCFLQTYEVHEPYVEDDHFRDPLRPVFDERPDSTIERDPAGRFVRVPRHAITPEDLADVGDWYDAAIRRMDARVGELLDALPALFGDEPYVVLFTSDHGEELGDRGQVGHAHGLHRELVHVPLLLAAPGLQPGRESQRVSLIDVVPTVLEAVGLEVPEHLPGRPLQRGAPPRPLVAALRPGTEALWADGYKLMVEAPDEGGARRLFELASDPDERADLASRRPDDVRRLSELLQASRGDALTRDDDAAGAALDPATLQNLRALGYLGDDG